MCGSGRDSGVIVGVRKREDTSLHRVTEAGILEYPVPVVLAAGLCREESHANALASSKQLQGLLCQLYANYTPCIITVGTN